MLPAESSTPAIVWCMDSPGFGGSEVSLMRVMKMVENMESVVLHGPVVCAEFSEFCHKHFFAMHVQSVSSPNPNSSKFALAGLGEANRWLKRFPRALFVIWAHHSDTQRWLQLALAWKRRTFVLCELLVPATREDFKTSRLSLPIKRFVAKRATCVVLNGTSQVEHYRNLFNVPKAKVQVICNSRPIRKINARAQELRAGGPALRKSLDLPEGPLIVCVARLVAQKNQTCLIEALSMLQTSGEPRPLLVLVGDGPDLEALKSQADRQLPGQVFFAGHQSDHFPWLAAADIFVLPSLFEGLPGAIIEAQASEIPCIATDIPGNRELVRDGETGLSVPVKDAPALALAIHRLLSNKPLSCRLALAGFELVARDYDEVREKSAWNVLVRNVLAGANL